MTDGGIFDRLLDDAAVFPPGNAPLTDAVADHLATRARPRGRFVGPFVCPAGRVEELAAALGSPAAAPPSGAPTDQPGALDLVLVGDGRSLADGVHAVLADDRLRLRAVEATAGAALPGGLPDDVAGVVEVGLDDGVAQRLRDLRRAGHRAKLRTGGLVAEAFPDEAALARALVACVASGVAMKLTAGLHSAVRHRDPVTGFEHHGFLNVLLALDAALEGAGPAAVAEVLGDGDGDRVARSVADLEPGQAARARRTLRSIGTCSIDEPLADLVALGLVDPGDVA